MSPNEFLIAFNGFRALIGDEAPSPEQWARICEFHTEAVGYEVKQKWARDEQERQMNRMLDDQKIAQMQQAKAYAQLLYAPNTTGTAVTSAFSGFSVMSPSSTVTIAKI